MEIDDFDRRLLRLVQNDAGQTAERLADGVGLSSSAVQRRLKRMRESGVIVRETAIVDVKSVGNPTFFVVALRVERHHAELLGQLRDWLTAEEHVQQVFDVTGEMDFVLVVTAPDTQSYDALMRRLMKDNPNVICFTTSVVLGVVKRGLTIPVPG